MPVMAGRLPLYALLSQALVAFVIEFDNEFEYRTPHRTSDYGATPAPYRVPWLVSMVMWTRFLRFVPDDGVLVRDLQLLSRTAPKELDLWLTRLSRWWGYLVIDSDQGARQSKRISADAIVRPTHGGRIALAVWRPLTGEIEDRWRQRSGSGTMDGLMASLREVAGQLDPALPGFLPILGYGLCSSPPDPKLPPSPEPVGDTSLPALLSKMLYAFAIDFERSSPVSLAMFADILRLTGPEGVPVRELPGAAFVSKEAVAMALSFLRSRGLAFAEPDASRKKVLRLTEKGEEVRRSCVDTIAAIEEIWAQRFGGDKLCALREPLEGLVGDPATGQSPLFQGLQPLPGCWRTSRPPLRGLPHFPMILHRGGFPDGS